MKNRCLQNIVVFLIIMFSFLSIEATQKLRIFENEIDDKKPILKNAIKKEKGYIVEEICDDEESGDTTISEEIIDIDIKEYPNDYKKNKPNGRSTLNTIYWEGQKENLYLMIKTLKTGEKIRINNEEEYFVSAHLNNSKIYKKIAEIYKCELKNLYSTLDILGIRKRKKWTNWENKKNVEILKKEINSGKKFKQLEGGFRSDFRTIKKVCEENAIDISFVKEKRVNKRKIKKWTLEEIEEIKTDRNNGESYHKIGSKFDVCRTVIKKIVEGKTNLNQDAWTEEEEEKLLKNVELYGRDWKKIGPLLQRTDNAVKSKHRKILEKNKKKNVIQNKKRKNNSSKRLSEETKRIKN